MTIAKNIKKSPITETTTITAYEEGAGGTTQKPETFLISLPPLALLA